MGERGAYRVRSRSEVSPFLRKQWCIYDTDSLKLLVELTARVLVNSLSDDEVIGGGSGALREDLVNAPGRLFGALCHVLYKPPFDMITNELHDVADHGVFEIEIAEWNRWILWHYDVDEHDRIIPDSKQKVLEVLFEKGKPVDHGIKFVYVSTKPEW